MIDVTVDASRCTGCLLCKKVCLFNFEKGENGKAHPTENAPLCVACGHCVAVCPTGAITNAQLADTYFEPIDRKAHPTYESLLALLKSRRSRREFKDKVLPPELIEKLLHAGMQAPNAINKQNVRYTVITDAKLLQETNEHIAHSCRKLVGILRNPAGRFLFKTLMPKAYSELKVYLPLIEGITKAWQKGQNLITYDAPCLILVSTPKTDSCGAEDAVYCASNIMLAAETLGVGSVVLGFITEPTNSDRKLKRLLRVPEDHQVRTTIALGYPRFDYSKSIARKNLSVCIVDGKQSSLTTT